MCELSRVPVGGSMGERGEELRRIAGSGEISQQGQEEADTCSMLLCFRYPRS